MRTLLSRLLAANTLDTILVLGPIMVVVCLFKVAVELGLL